MKMDPFKAALDSVKTGFGGRDGRKGTRVHQKEMERHNGYRTGHQIVWKKVNTVKINVCITVPSHSHAVSLSQ